MNTEPRHSRCLPSWSISHVTIEQSPWSVAGWRAGDRFRCPGCHRALAYPRTDVAALHHGLVFGRQVLRRRRTGGELVVVMLEQLAKVTHVEHAPAERAALEVVALARYRFAWLSRSFTCNFCR
jgi:hypothetical protein